MADEPFPEGFEPPRPAAIGRRHWTFTFPGADTPYAQYSVEILDQRGNVFATKDGNLFPEPDHLNGAEKQALLVMDARLKAKAEEAWIR